MAVLYRAATALLSFLVLVVVTPELAAAQDVNSVPDCAVGGSLNYPSEDYLLIFELCIENLRRKFHG